MKFLLFRLVIATCLLTYTFEAKADSTFIKFGASWKYLDTGVDPGAQWKNVSASGTESWASGPAKFGYENSDARTFVNYGGNAARKYATTYFRTSFNINNVSLFSFFKLKVYVDDGMVVYVNGKEVCRYNMGAGTVSYNTSASGKNTDNGNVTIPFKIPIEEFVNGINHIAVEVHQYVPKSEDLTFDLELTGISKSNPTEITRGPLLQMVSGNAITIIWRTNDLASSRIQYGTSENQLVSSVKKDALSKDHEIRITGLLPDTKYFYAVGTTGDILEGSYRDFFTTSPPANTTRKIRIGVFGDAGTGNIHQKSGRDSYLKQFKNGKSAELALMLGDNAYNTGTDHEYQTNFFDIYDDNIFNNTVVFPVPGNHEYYSPDVPYFSIFSLPTAGESGGLPSGTKSYYSFNYGNIHVVMLNSMGVDGGAPLRDSTGAQAEWLKKDLAANAGKFKWTIACLHHPPYTNGTHNSDAEWESGGIRQQITPIFERYGVDVVLSGHSHVYERSFLIQDHTGLSKTFKASAPSTGNLVSSSSALYDGSPNSCPYFTIDTVAKKGTVYVVAGSAGQVGGGTNVNMPLFYYKNSSGSPNGEGGSLYLEVQENRLDAKFVSWTGFIRDQFTIMKGVNTKKIIATEVNKDIDLTASWVGNYNWSPAPPAGNDGLRKITVRLQRPDTYTYYVKDSIGSSATCISDTFEVQASSASPASSVKFEARQKYNSVLTKWSVETDPKIKYFTIERSSNGRDFNMITLVKPVVNASSGSPFASASTSVTYEFEDKYPLHGPSYYRLKKTNNDGQPSILGVRTVDYKALKSFTYTVKSNSATKNTVNIAIESSKKQLLKIKMYDMSGKMVYYHNLEAAQGSNHLKVFLTAGIYVLNITDAENILVAEKLELR